MKNFKTLSEIIKSVSNKFDYLRRKPVVIQTLKELGHAAFLINPTYNYITCNRGGMIDLFVKKPEYETDTHCWTDNMYDHDQSYWHNNLVYHGWLSIESNVDIANELCFSKKDCGIEHSDLNFQNKASMSLTQKKDYTIKLLKEFGKLIFLVTNPWANYNFITVTPKGYITIWKKKPQLSKDGTHWSGGGYFATMKLGSYDGVHESLQHCGNNIWKNAKKNEILEDIINKYWKELCFHRKECNKIK